MLQKPAAPTLWPAQQQQQLQRCCMTRCRRQLAATSVRASFGFDRENTKAQQDALRVTRMVADSLQGWFAKTAHMYLGPSAAQLQGVPVPERYKGVQISVQWDSLQDLHAKLVQEGLQPDPIQQHGRGQLCFIVHLHGTCVLIQCDLNTVLHMEPSRVQVHDAATQRTYWCQTLLAVRRTAQPDLAAAVNAHLQKMQEHLTAANAKAWSQADAEAAWVTKLGHPKDTADRIRHDPWLRLGHPLFKHLPENLAGLKVTNLLGSHGTKAVAAAVLGANVTCVDISPNNAAYCAEVAAAAGVPVDFIVADVLDLPPQLLTGAQDVVFLELGVLHYFLDLEPLMTVVRQLLKPGGCFILREFHPVSTKLITSKGKHHKVTGNYFSQELMRSRVAYSKYAQSNQSRQGDRSEARSTQVVQLRQWAVGEVVTAVCESGLVMQCLEEEPGVKTDDAGVPKVFTLVARKRV